MPLVAGVDSSTQSCKVVVCDAETGAVVRSGAAPHPEGTEVHPDHWWDALQQAIAAAGGLDDVAAIAVGGQQHGMVCLDEAGEVVRPALLWNDTRSAQSALDLIDELGGAQAWVDAVGLVLKRYRGVCPVYLSVRDANGKQVQLKLNDEFRVNPADLKVEELEMVLGTGAVLFSR